MLFENTCSVTFRHLKFSFGYLCLSCSSPIRSCRGRVSALCMWRRQTTWTGIRTFNKHGPKVAGDGKDKKIINWSRKWLLPPWFYCIAATSQKFGLWVAEDKLDTFSNIVRDTKSFAMYRCTLPKTNISPENRPSQKESSIPTIHFRGIR